MSISNHQWFSSSFSLIVLKDTFSWISVRVILDIFMHRMRGSVNTQQTHTPVSESASSLHSLLWFITGEVRNPQLIDLNCFPKKIQPSFFVLSCCSLKCRWNFPKLASLHGSNISLSGCTDPESYSAVCHKGFCKSAKETAIC